MEETQSVLNEIETNIDALQQENKQLDQKARQKRSEIKQVERSLKQQSRLCRIYDYKLHNTELEVGQVREDLARLNQGIAKQQTQLQLELQQLELLGLQRAPHRLLVRGANAEDEYFVAKTTARHELEKLRQQLADQAMLQDLLEEIGTSNQQTEIVSQQSQEARQSTEKRMKSDLRSLESLMRTKR